MSIKQKLHELIESIDDEQVLEAYFHLLKPLNEEVMGGNWSNLNDSEKEELLVSYDESFAPKNLVDHSVVMERARKWNVK